MNKSESTLTPTNKPQKKGKRWWRVLLWTNAIILLLMIVIVLFNFRPLPKDGTALVEISPGTTYATGPLKDSGDVDYVGYLNKLNFVPPEQNAMVDLIQVLGPTLDRKLLPDEFFLLLRIPPPPPEGDYIVFFDSFCDAKPQVTINGVTLNRRQIERIIWSVPYSKGQLPIVDDWLNSNQLHLKAIRQAVKKPDYYKPLVGDSVIEDLTFGAVSTQRSIARALNASAMGRLGNGDVDGAIDDQLAILRLGRMLGRHGSMVELLVGIAIDGIGQSSLAQTIYSGKCDAEQFKRLARELDSLPPPPQLGKQHMTHERALGLEFVILAGRNGPMPWEQGGSKFASGNASEEPGLIDMLVRCSVDWDVVCQEMNGYYDQIESVFDGDDLLKQVEKIRNPDPGLVIAAQGPGGAESFNELLFGGRTGRGKAAARVFGNLLLPAVEQVLEAGRRSVAYDANTRIAVALEQYRLEHKTYPQKLVQLVPEFLNAVPRDPFSGTLPIYDSQKGDPYLLYSVGHNGIDDGGISMYDAAYDESDLPAVPEMQTLNTLLEKIDEENREYDLEDDSLWEDESESIDASEIGVGSGKDDSLDSLGDSMEKEDSGNGGDSNDSDDSDAGDGVDQVDQANVENATQGEQARLGKVTPCDLPPVRDG